MQKRASASKSKKSAASYQTFVLLILFAIVIGVILSAIQLQQSLRSKAGSNTLKLYIQPSAISLSKDASVQIWATADNPVAFLTTKIIFDPAVIQLKGDITSTSPLTRVIRKTAYTDANTSGVLYLSVALDPAMKASPPYGTFQIATMTIAPKTASKNLSTSIRLDPAALQAVHADTSLFTISTIESVLTVNPTSQTPVQTPTYQAQIPLVSLSPTKTTTEERFIPPENPQIVSPVIMKKQTPPIDIFSWWQIVIEWIQAFIRGMF